MSQGFFASFGLDKICCLRTPAACKPLCCKNGESQGGEVINSNPTVAELLQVLKAGGGVEETPGAKSHEAFLRTIDELFSELRFYRTGRIQTSPGVEEVEGSPAEYFRTVGAMIALLAAYASANGDEEFGLQAVSAGNRGPMSLDKAPGKFINIGNKPAEYAKFCEAFAEGLPTEDDWWAMLVFLAIHDVGKSDEFRAEVNATLAEAKRSDDHDRALARALCDPELVERLLPSVNKLSKKRQQAIAAGFSTNFQLPQLGQGEIAVINMRGLLDMPEEHLSNSTLRNYMYHSIFDIAGTTSTEAFIFPLALVPVYCGFVGAMDDLINALQDGVKQDERDLYFRFLHGNFKKAYPGFDMATFQPLCESRIFRDEVGLVLLRLLALTRNTYQNPEVLLEAVQTDFQFLVQEMAGKVSGPQIMLYYGPDLLRMGLGTDMADETGENIRHALRAFEGLYRLGRAELVDSQGQEFQYELNVNPAVAAIKKAGKEWRGGIQLKEVCSGVRVKSNDLHTEGVLILGEAPK